jgi:hypothetical protein
MVENEFANVLTVHQAMGRGITNFAKGNEQALKNYQTELSAILEQLLPSAPKRSIATYAEKFIDLAVAFKDGIAQEQALLYVFFVGNKELFQDERMEVIDDNPGGPVLICTFPGLIRRDADKTTAIRVKADALLKSSVMVEQ